MFSALAIQFGVSESSVDRIRSAEDLIYPHRAGISTLVLGPGCCGFVGPVPSATLDKRCRSAADRVYKTAFSCQAKIGIGDRESQSCTPLWPGIVVKMTTFRVPFPIVKVGRSP